MSDITSNVNLKPIQAPELTSTAYGKNVKEQFKNIDDNFRMLSNKDFVAGKEGSSIFYTEKDLYIKVDDTSGYFTELGCAMLNAITNKSLTEEKWNDNEYYDNYPDLTPIQVGSTIVNLFDYIKENPRITVLYTLKDTTAGNGDDAADDSNRAYICSPQVYTFLDMRFSNVEDGGGISGDNSSFAELIDFSCILTLEYKELLGENNNVQLKPIFNKANLFPTLYFDPDEKVFKWRIYSNKTGVRATGPKGESGSRAAVWIVRTGESQVEEPTREGLASVTDYLSRLAGSDDSSEWGWININDYDYYGTRPEIKDVCIVLSSNSEVNLDDSDDSDDFITSNDGYISPILVFTGQDEKYVIKGADNSLLLNVTVNSLKKMLQKVTPDSNILSCLFLRYDSQGTGTHLIYATDDPNGDDRILHLKPTRTFDDDILSKPSDAARDENGVLHVDYASTTIKGTLNVDGKTTIRNNVDIRGKAYIGGDTEINGTVLIGATTTINEQLNVEGDTVINGTLRVDEEATAKVNGISDVYLGCPIGTVVMWAGSEFSIPDEWLLCNGDYFNNMNNIVQGKIVTPDERDRLNSILVNAYGPYKLPNLQQRFPLGAQYGGSIAVGQTGAADYAKVSTNVGSTGGSSVVKLTIDQIPQHYHGYKEVRLVSDTGSATVINGAGAGEGTTNKTTDGIYGYGNHSTFVHNNTPPFLTINFIIKYK